MLDEKREVARLHALRQLDLLDTPPSEAFDRITRMAAQLFDVPIAAVSLTDRDRQWFKSRVGVDHTSITRDKAPCAQVAETGALLVVPDLLADEGYRDCPLARNGIRFYAGASLTTRDGFSLGAMCVLGTQPRQVREHEARALEDLAAMVMAQIELQHAFGRIDPLSGLANRTQFIEDLEDLAKESPPGSRRTAALVDLASAEQISGIVRILGTAHVDGMVRQAALAVGTALGREIRLYHVAATQFAFLVPAGQEEAEAVAAVNQALDADRKAGSSHPATTAVIGVAPFAVGVTTPHDAMRMAHGAAEAARGNHSRTSTYSPAEDTVYRRRFILLHDFEAALSAPDQLRLAYQPRIDLRSGACTGAEVLLRWTHPRLGPIPPGEIVPIIERTSLVRGLTDWVIGAAVGQLGRWRDAGKGLQLSVNVSAANLAEEDFTTRLLDMLAKEGVAPARLELEVTESAMMENAAQAVAVLQAVAMAGVGVAIDDFGTGYSSLSYLQRLPAHAVKLDRSFTHDCADEGRRQALVTTMISLCHDLGYRVVAEGIETPPVLATVRQAGCDEGQGYLFGRPMDEDQFTEWHDTWKGVEDATPRAGLPEPGNSRSGEGEAGNRRSRSPIELSPTRSFAHIHS